MSYTQSGKLHTDPRIHEAKKLLIEAISERQKQITGPKPADPNLKLQYEKVLKSFGEDRGWDLWFPYIGSGIGKGALVELLDGSVKYDCIGGIGVYFMGHSHHELIESGIDAAISNTVMQGHLQQNADSVDLVKMLVKTSHLDHCFLTTSGSMANENAIKMALQKHHPANRILAFESNFCGRSWVMAEISDKPFLRSDLPIKIHVDYIPYYNANKPEESTKKAIESLKTHLKRYPRQHAAMMFELIQGEAGFYPGTKEFFEPLMKILKEHEIAIIADEVQTFGRTSQLFAYQHYGLDKYIDIVTLGKLSQICATLFKKDYTPRVGLLGQTFTSSTSAIHAAKVVLQSLLRDSQFGKDGRNNKIHERFKKNLKKIVDKHPNLISGPFGIGAMIAFTPYDGSPEKVKGFVKRLFDNGVMAFIAGMNPTRARMLVPAIVITNDDIDAVCQIIEETLVQDD